MMIERVTVCKEERTITRSNGHTLQVRDLTSEEITTMITARDILVNKYKYSIALNARDEFESFMNEEAFLYTCKFNGNGDLMGYLLTYLKQRVFNFSRTYKLHMSRYHHSPECKRDTDESETLMLWDKSPDSIDFSELSIKEQLGILNERESKIVQLLMDGYPKTEICAMMGIGRVTVHRDIKRVKKKIRNFYSDNMEGGNNNENL
ncbi:hypothetical protein BC7_00063 [Bacillus phage BC-7]|nr:hypothetical protein BC7_00063 [Bacillus phage BC-7]